MVHISATAGVGAMKNAAYHTDLSDAQWAYLEPILPKPARTGRPPTNLRVLVNALLYVVKAGCSWRLLPKTFPPYQTVYHVFAAWSRDGIMASIHDRLRAHARESAGRRSRATAAIIDSQTVRSAGFAEEAGYDAGKKTKGRKRFIMVDTLGHILSILVTPADRPERDGAAEMLEANLAHHGWLRKIWVDGGYTGDAFANHVKEIRPDIDVEVVKRSDSVQGFHVLPRRWVVERTFGWLMQCRRLVRDYERTVRSATGWIHLAMIRIMLRRLA
jgi:transposase